MMYKQRTLSKGLLLLSTLIGLLLVTQVSYAESPTKGVLRGQRQELTQEKKDLVKEKTKNMLEQVKDVIKEKIKRQIKGKLMSITGNTLTVQQKDQTTFTVIVTDKTELKRKFGAASSLSEFSINDQLLIIGNRKKNTDGTLSSTEIEASYIRNMSIQRRFAVFNGEITNKSSNTLTLKTIGRGTQTVYVSSKTEYKERNKTIALSDIQIGDKVVVKGELWDRVSGKIDAKIILRISVKPKVTPTPTKPL